MISLAFLLSADPNITDLPQRETPQILAGIKLSIFDILAAVLSETVQDRVQDAINH